MANGSRRNGSSAGLGGAYSTTLPKGDVRTKQDFANNQQIIREMAKAQRAGDWVKYQQLQNNLKHAA